MPDNIAYYLAFVEISDQRPWISVRWYSNGRPALFMLHCTLVTVNCTPVLVRRTVNSQTSPWAVGRDQNV